MCGGTLIDARHVLTAAHCINPTEDYTVTVGLHDRNAAHFMEQKIKASKIYVHEQYDSIKITNDIAIIYLSKAVEVTDKVNFICLPGPEADIGANVYVCKKNSHFVSLHVFQKRQSFSLFLFFCSWLGKNSSRWFYKLIIETSRFKGNEL